MKLINKSKSQGLEIQEINENMCVVSSPAMTFSLDDEKLRQFGVVFETCNMYDATGESEFKQYPFVVSASIVAMKPHKSFDENDSGKTDSLSLIEQALGYMGGVCVDHVLTHAIKNSSESGSPDDMDESNFDLIAAQFSVKEASLITETHEFGTIAAQMGKGAEFSHLRFKDENAATKYIKLLTERVPALSMLIGFILDRPLNMVGDDGWKTMNQMVKGCK